MRRPARQELAGHMTPRDRIWMAIRFFGRLNPFSAAEIIILSRVEVAEEPQLRADTVLSYLAGLQKAGYVVDIGLKRPALRPCRELRSFFLERDVGIEAPRIDANGKPVTQGLAQLQMWNTMRHHKGEFDCRFVAFQSSTPEQKVTLNDAKTYVKFLARAGYLAIKREAEGPKPARYRFLASRNTGNRAPLITGKKTVLDGNTGEVVLENFKEIAHAD